MHVKVGFVWQRSMPGANEAKDNTGEKESGNTEESIQRRLIAVTEIKERIQQWKLNKTLTD